MTDSAYLEPPQEFFEPEYPGSETHPSVRIEERVEPWLVATADFLSDHEFSHGFASGRCYDAPTMMKAFVYQRIVGVGSFHRLASHLDGRPKVAALLGFTEAVPSGDTFREWWKSRLGDRERGATETVVAGYFRPELADHLLDMGLPAGASLLDPRRRRACAECPDPLQRHRVARGDRVDGAVRGRLRDCRRGRAGCGDVQPARGSDD